MTSLVQAEFQAALKMVSDRKMCFNVYFCCLCFGTIRNLNVLKHSKPKPGFVQSLLLTFTYNLSAKANASAIFSMPCTLGRYP